METFSGVHGGFRLTKPNKFSNVQKSLKFWFTMVVINFKIYFIIFLTEENKITFVISHFEITIFH